MLDFFELKQSARGKYAYFEGHYQRCRKIEDLIKSRPYSSSELAYLFSVSVRTIRRNMRDISTMIPIVFLDGRWRFVDKM